ncbi:VOC family protein [Kibdelosporangium phytohabitans]|uniref:Bleomycin resistance protein n=1 Tax=Kibdelosporangium phytohabitans TaxID=860235 RepID=A0A0N9I4X6_9PSEU|nr:VOC family protein [Kibdelosporangium phytohabitans]ALG15102.1 bleomycin resistance protein [Kibdelosporangium phytohabitans]
MSLNAVAHLNFHGQARAALEFYQSVFGGQLTVTTYADFGMPADLPGATNVVFGQVVAGNGFRVMAYDVPGQDVPAAPGAPTTRRENGTTITTEPYFLSVRGESADEVTPVWEGLATGATVIEPFGPAQWAPAFGMLADRFGVTWIVDVAAQA